MLPPPRHPMYALVAVIACLGGATGSALGGAPRLALAWVVLAALAAWWAWRRVAAHRRDVGGGRP